MRPQTLILSHTIPLFISSSNQSTSQKEQEEGWKGADKLLCVHQSPTLLFMSYIAHNSISNQKRECLNSSNSTVIWQRPTVRMNRGRTTMYCLIAWIVNTMGKKMIRNIHSWDKIQAGLVLRQSYDLERCHANWAQNSHLKQCIS
jgi:hypothetical protein